MIYFILSLFIGLIVLLICYTVFALNSMVNNPKESTKPDYPISKLDLNKWRGGVRFPAGYYKSPEDFYQIEKK